MSVIKGRGRPSQARGFSLIVVLLLLVAVTILAVGGARLSLLNERGARNDRDTEIALQAAEAALVDAELDVLGPNPSSNSRLCLFNNKNLTPFIEGCAGSNQNLGLCAAAKAGAAPAWMAADLSPESKTSVAYGTFTGQEYVTGHGATPAALPRYVIEVLRNNGGWESGRIENASSEGATYIFRVTAIGYGVDPATHVVLQTNLYKSAVSPGCP